MNPIYRHYGNARQFEQQVEKNSGISEAVPDQNMSIREIVERYARGLPINGNVKVPLYEYDEENDQYMPDLSKMDKADRMMAIQEASEELYYLNQTLKQNAQDKADNDAAADKARLAALESKLSELGEEPTKKGGGAAPDGKTAS